jgi:TIR domain/Caspase domain
MVSAIRQDERLKVFVSYSRADVAFADELVAGLEFDGGFEVAIDRHSIDAGEEWSARLSNLIAAADTVVFLLSPNSAMSSACRREVDQATLLSKRILPVLIEAVPDGSAPEALSAINYVRFDGGRSFMAGLAELRRALNTDIGWIREHTRLQERAREWHAAGRIANRLLTGADIAEAKAWLQKRPVDAPDPTDLHRDYILACEAAEVERESAEQKRLAEMAAAQAAQARALVEREEAVSALSRRTAMGLVSAGSLTVLAGGLAYWGVNAEERFRKSQEEARVAAKKALEDAIRMKAERTDVIGQVVAYAASRGQWALDGPKGGNSPYTEVVLKALGERNVSIQAALEATNEKVRVASGMVQRPFYATDMNGEIFLQRQPSTRRRKAVVVSVDRLQVPNQPAMTYPNTTNDARDWAATLRSCGFECSVLSTPDLPTARDQIEAMTFAAPEKKGALPSLVHRAGLKLEPDQRDARGPDNTLVMFYFAGQGLSVDGKDYLTFKVADLTSAQSVRATCLDVAELTSTLRRAAAASIIVLDTGFFELFGAR